MFIIDRSIHGMRDAALRTASEIELELRYAYKYLVSAVRIDSPPVFIVGCGHSGTTLLLKVIGSHSRIHPIHYESRIAERDAQQQKSLLRTFDKLCIAAGKHRWVEKTPRNIHHIDKLLALREGARVIVVVRDGRDVACSLKERYKSFQQGIERWVFDNKAALRFRSEPRVLYLRYEDLIGSFEATVTKALKFIGEDFEQAINHFHTKPLRFQEPGISSVGLAARLPSMLSMSDRVERKRSEQIHQPLFDARGRWREQITVEELALFNDLAENLLETFDYERV